MELRRNLLVGMFVLVGLIALAVLTVLFGRDPTWLIKTNRYPLAIHFNAVSGIRPGTLVEVSGKEIGRVDRVEFRDSSRLTEGVVVVVLVEQQYQLRDGSFAETMEAGMLAGGRPPIRITPGDLENPILSEGQAIPGRIRSAVDLMFPPDIVGNLNRTAGQIGDAAAALKPVLEDLHVVLQPREIGQVDQPGGLPGNLSTAVARLDAALRHINSVIGDGQVQSQLRETVNNLHTMSADGKDALAQLKEASGEAKTAVTGFKDLAVKGQESLTKLDQQVDNVARSTTDGLERVSGFLDQLSLIATDLRDGRGTLGRLLTDDRLYESLVLTFRRLAETTEEFRMLVKDWQKGKIRVGL